MTDERLLYAIALKPSPATRLALCAWVWYAMPKSAVVLYAAFGAVICNKTRARRGREWLS